MNLKDIIKRISIAFSNRDVKELKVVHDICTYELGLTHEKNVLSVAILAYSLAKFLTKPRLVGEFSQEYVIRMRELLQSAKYVNSDEQLNKIVQEAIGIIIEWENTDKRFAKSIIQKAKLKIAATLYAQGFSLKTTSELTGAEETDIMSYIGSTLFADRLKEGLDIHERLKRIEKLIEPP